MGIFDFFKKKKVAKEVAELKEEDIPLINFH
jgi:hypothetical protein